MKVEKIIDALEEIISIAKDNTKNGLQETEARILSLKKSIKEGRFSSEDSFELSELVGDSFRRWLDSLDDRDFNALINTLIGGNTRRVSIERSKGGSELEEVAELFIKFCKDNGFSLIKEFDRFKPIYEKFIQIYPKEDDKVKDIKDLFDIYRDLCR